MRTPLTTDPRSGSNKKISANSMSAFGAWKSPITSQLLTAGSLRLGQVRIAAQGQVIWNEGRPMEAGRSVLVRATHDAQHKPTAPTDVTGPDFNVRTLVHEYGGGEYLVHANALFFSNMKDQRIYSQSLDLNLDMPPTPLTDATSNLRFANYVLDTPRQRLIAVVEDHTDDRPSHVKNFIGAISIKGADKDGNFLPVETLVEGKDFYASPTLSPDGTSLAYVSWNHPMMPWDETTLSVSSIEDDGTVGTTRIVAGDYNTATNTTATDTTTPTTPPATPVTTPQSVMSPLFSPIDGALYFITDTTGWWSIWREEQQGGACVPVAAKEGVEFGGPAWTLGHQPYTFLPSGEVLCTFGGPSVQGGDQLGLIDPCNGNALTVLATPPFSALGNVAVGKTSDDQWLIGLVGGSSSAPTSVKTLVVASATELINSTAADWNTVRLSSTVVVDESMLSKPEKIEFPTAQGRTSHLYYYPPTNGSAIHAMNATNSNDPNDALPPLLIKSHGGPTSSSSSAFNLAIQYWTSRGIAVADVNYGGSTGYGKEYRQRLTHPPSWGIVDVDDCTNAAKYLAQEGRVDAARMAISGGSAGGFTTLACLAFRDVFAAGASHYGIGNLEALASDTHKFESRYLDRLVGEYPKELELYQARSPIQSVGTFSCPLIQFQGLEDKVVPPNQAMEVYQALKEKGVPTACILFEGEQHGFRREGNIRRALDTELEFYGQVFGFQPILPDDHVPLVMGEQITVGC